MRERALILAGLAAFVALVTWPAWRALAAGRPAAAPVLAKAKAGSRCVEPVEYMRASHMTLLAAWRDRVVRDGVRTTAAYDGRTVVMSLTGTCLECHGDRAKFCDRCHDYMAARPACWECHDADPAGGRR
jgi:hypothetical protein